MTEEFVRIETPAAQEERREAMRRLMALPDPPDIRGRRRFRWRFGGDKARQPFLKAELEAAHMHHAMEAAGRGASAVICVRRERREAMAAPMTGTAAR